MRSRIDTRLLFALSLIVALFVLPSIAAAMPAMEVTGTVTAAGTAAPLAGVTVEAYTWDSGSEDWDFDSRVYTGEDGTYNIGLTPDTWLLRAIDETGTYDPAFSGKLVTIVGEDKKVDFALSKDVTAPSVEGEWMPEGYRSMVAAIPVFYQGWDALAYRGAFYGGVVANDSRWVIDPYGSVDPWTFRGSGVATLAYSINGGAEIVKSTADEVPDAQMVATARIAAEGLNVVTYYAIDKNGNKSKTFSDLMMIDLTPTSTGYSNNGKGITLKPADALSGVAGTFYRIGTSGEFKSGTYVALPKSGSFVLQFYSVDKVGNVEAVKSVTVYAPAKLSTPKVSKTSVSHSKSFKVTGSVYGRSKAKGSVYVYKLTNGKYKYVSRKTYTEASNGKFSVSLKLKKGTYRFKTHYGANTATSANMSVLSKYSAKVKVY